MDGIHAKWGIKQNQGHPARPELQDRSAVSRRPKQIIFNPFLGYDHVLGHVLGL